MFGFTAMAFEIPFFIERANERAKIEWLHFFSTVCLYAVRF